MKRQYLGDSKDSFKWDYLHFLIEAIGYGQLQIVWMMTPDDHRPDGGTPPERFPARPEILKLCNCLKESRDPGLLADLPVKTSTRYMVNLYKPDAIFMNTNRETYFSDFPNAPDQILFLDPDNGFQPEHKFNEKHILYDEVERILKKVTPYLCGHSISTPSPEEIPRRPRSNPAAPLHRGLHCHLLALSDVC